MGDHPLHCACQDFLGWPSKRLPGVGCWRVDLAHLCPLAACALGVSHLFHTFQEAEEEPPGQAGVRSECGQGQEGGSLLGVPAADSVRPGLVEHQLVCNTVLCVFSCVSNSM